MTWNGYPTPGRDEDDMEEPWADPYDGDLPGQPRGPEDEEWKAAKPDDWRRDEMGPEEKMFRDLVDEAEDPIDDDEEEGR
jgi:hypothetical protein